MNKHLEFLCDFIKEHGLAHGEHGRKVREAIDGLIQTLQAETWHPIERAADLGAKDGREVLLHNQTDGVTWFASWDRTDNNWYSEYPVSNPTHFRFSNPPEEA